MAKLLARRVRERRESLGFTQAGLAHQVSLIRGERLSQQTIADIENDKTKLRPSCINELAQALQTTTDYLLGTATERQGFIALYLTKVAHSPKHARYTLNSHQLVERPPFVRTADAWSVQLSNDCMAPLYDPGDTLFLDPSEKVRVGHDYLFVANPTPAKGASCAIGRLLRQSRNHWLIQCYTPPELINLPRRTFPFAVLIAGSQNRR